MSDFRREDDEKMYPNNKKNAYKVVMLLIITIFVTILLTIIGFSNYLKKDNNIKYIISSVKTNDIETEILKIRSVIDEYYLKEIDEQKLIDGAIKGYVEALGDKYTQYLDKEEWTQMETDTLGHYVGIGVYISSNTETNEITVISPIDGSPAQIAGIKPDDVIIKVDDVPYTGEEIDIAAEKLKGEAGTTVKLEIKRGDKTLTFDIERKDVRMNAVTSKIIEGDIAYIILPSFDEGTAEDFKQNVEKMMNEGAKKIIIDARNNTGGLVSEAIKIADYIVPKGKTLMITIDKDGNVEETKAKENNFITEDIVMLINGNSASSTEILAGALKDNGRAKLVGTKTYGKGVMQQILQLPEGSALKITTQEFKTPNGDQIDGVGISPDEEVKLVADDEGNIADIQLQKAIEMLK